MNLHLNCCTADQLSAAERQRIVLVEKPLAPTADEAAQIVAAAREAGVFSGGQVFAATFAAADPAVAVELVSAEAIRPVGPVDRRPGYLHPGEGTRHESRAL